MNAKANKTNKPDEKTEVPEDKVELEDKVEDNSEDIAKLKSQVEALTKEKTELEEIVNTPADTSMADENEKLKARIEELQAAASEGDTEGDMALLTASKKIETLEGELAEQKTNVAGLMSQLEGRTSSNSNEIQSLHAENAKLREKEISYDEVVRQKDMYIEQVRKLTTITVPKSSTTPIRLPASFTPNIPLKTNTVYEIDVDGTEGKAQAELIGTNMSGTGSTLIYQPGGSDQKFMLENMQIMVEKSAADPAEPDQPGTYRVVLRKLR